MKCMVIILNKVECLNDLLNEFATHGIKGATILSSTGMAHQLLNADSDESVSIFGSLRYLLNPEGMESKTILCVLKSEQVKIAKDCLVSVLGDLNKPDTGVIFTVPVDYFEGANLGE